MRDERAARRALIRRPYILPHPLLLVFLVFALFGVMSAVSPSAAEPAPQRAAQLAYMVRQDCGSCHGLTLAGGLGPPLLPAALAGKPAAYLKHVILNGTNDTAMPAWSRRSNAGLNDASSIAWA